MSAMRPHEADPLNTTAGMIKESEEIWGRRAPQAAASRINCSRKQKQSVAFRPQEKTISSMQPQAETINSMQQQIANQQQALSCGDSLFYKERENEQERTKSI